MFSLVFFCLFGFSKWRKQPMRKACELEVKGHSHSMLIIRKLIKLRKC